MKLQSELHIVIDKDGVRSVQIIGPPEVHPEGHSMYMKIRHLIPPLDRQIQELLKNDSLEEEKKLGTEKNTKEKLN